MPRPADRRFYITQIAISVGVNIVMAGLFTWLLSDADKAASGRFGDALGDLANATAGAAFGVTFGATIPLRAQVRRGTLAPMPGPPLLPRNLLVRSVMIWAGTMVVLAVPAAAILAGSMLRGWDFLLFKAGYGAVTAVVVTPVILVAALRDR